MFLHRFSDMLYKSFFIDSAKIMGFKPELFRLEEPFIRKTSKKKRRQQKIDPTVDPVLRETILRC